MSCLAKKANVVETYVRRLFGLRVLRCGVSMYFMQLANHALGRKGQKIFEVHGQRHLQDIKTRPLTTNNDGSLAAVDSTQSCKLCETKVNPVNRVNAHSRSFLYIDCSMNIVLCAAEKACNFARLESGVKRDKEILLRRGLFRSRKEPRRL